MSFKPPKITVKLTDKGMAKSVAAMFGKRAAYVKVGVFGDKGAEQAAKGALDMAALAAVHEFGLGNNPERSFLRSYIDANEVKLRKMLLVLMEKEIGRAVKSGRPITDSDRKRVLEKLGLVMVAGIQERIANGEITPPLTEQTIARKGSSTPLVDTGQLRSSISHEVELG